MSRATIREALRVLPTQNLIRTAKGAGGGSFVTTPSLYSPRNRDFHAALVAGSGNTFLAIAAQPAFAVLQTNLKRSTLGRYFHKTINHDHRLILEAVEAGDEEATAEEMRKHLDFLRPMYEKAWRYKRRRAPAPASSPS